jgi:hypothetical protein
MQTGHEWIEAFAVGLGADPLDAETLDKLLELAGVAAHSSERWTAPLACYLVGLTQVSVERALAVARSTADSPA